MNTPARILIVLAVAITVVAVIVFKNNRPPAGSAAAGLTAPAATNDTALPAVVPAKLPRLVDLGADKCIPCKMMAPILAELKKEYAGRLHVEFIDVWKNPDAGKQYGIEVIPTQIFYDAEGKELVRHVGFVSKEDILAKWKELGVDVTGKTNSETPSDVGTNRPKSQI